ncbi:hypothetical protein MUK42_20407 [Musa troglodytarum]|uniref:Uncharacterized protein n=1 Tax=Musa troglodytarum TaxID=320322 RepID=A0A9E7EP67_9LILI|nr:hypothetical protein MUK42_20407 [Musa troglodytarum]
MDPNPTETTPGSWAFPCASPGSRKERNRCPQRNNLSYKWRTRPALSIDLPQLKLRYAAAHGRADLEPLKYMPKHGMGDANP